MPIHINIDDEVQVDYLFRITDYINRHREQLSKDEIAKLMLTVHNIKGDAQHDRERKLEQREPRDPQDWGQS